MQFVKLLLCLCLYIILPTEASEGKSYKFSYKVKDDYGNDYGHDEFSDGDLVIGEYRTLLPDGRLQIVKYQADSKNGYEAQITYIDNKETFIPVVDNDINSQGLQPCRNMHVGSNCNPESTFEGTDVEEDR